MKNKAIIAIALTMALFVLTPSCTKENGIGGNDNIGIEYRMGNDVFFLDEINLSMLPSNNFYTYGRIASVGPVGSLSRIKNIPESGWATVIAVHPGYGYVLDHGEGNWEYRYTRVYVEDWIHSTDGGIIGAIIWYEADWKK